jgi:hypothetical protein
MYAARYLLLTPCPQTKSGHSETSSNGHKNFMNTEEKCELIADKIKNIISEGIDLSEDVVHYIDSTFSNPTVKELQAILADDANCEKDTLMELLLFPDESFQIQLEKTLERHRHKKEDEKIIWAHLCRETLQVTFRFTDDRGEFALQVPEDVIHQFLIRLKIAKHLDASLIESIHNYGDDQNTGRFKVKIRNSRFSS